MTDFDKKMFKENCRKCYPNECAGHNAGRDLAQSIADALPHKDISWAVWSENEVYPHGAKDAGDMTPKEIRDCIVNAKSDLEYSSLGLY